MVKPTHSGEVIHLSARRIARATHKLAAPLITALEHIETQGSLISLVTDRTQRVGLMKELTAQKLVAWDPRSGKYELTRLGRQSLAEQRARLVAS
jgi:hypothetical protein